MTVYFPGLAPENLPDVEYTRVNEEQAAHIRAAMELPDNQANFDVSLLPVETAEQRQAAAEEWAGYLQAKGSADARDQGAVFVINGRDESPEALARLFEDEDTVIGRKFVTHALLKVVKKNRDAKTTDLLRTYYHLDED